MPSQHTHRGAWRAWGAFTAFQSKRPLQSNNMWAGRQGETPPGLGSLQLRPPGWPLTHHWTRKPSVPGEAT